YYRLDETTGSTAVDSSGNGNDGTYVNGPTIGQSGALAGDPDTSVAFDATSNQNVTLPVAPFGPYPPSGVTNAYVVSFEAWFNTTSQGIILGQTGGGYVPAVYVGSDGKVHASMFWHNAVTNQIVSPTTYNDGNWHQVVDVYDNGLETLYV